MSSSGSPQPGWFEPSDGATEANRIMFIVRQLLGLARTAAIVQVKAVNAAAVGGLIFPVGTVDVQILVKLIDSQGGLSSHGTISKLPYFRVQGGANAIVMDPAINDIGLAVICDRDSSSVKNAQAEAPPGSFRRNDLADGMYFGGFLNKTPTCYIQFTGNGIVIKAPTGVNVQGNLGTTGNLSAGNGITGSFTTATGQIVTVQNGIITSIA